MDKGSGTGYMFANQTGLSLVFAVVNLNPQSLFYSLNSESNAGRLMHQILMQISFWQPNSFAVFITRPLRDVGTGFSRHDLGLTSETSFARDAVHLDSIYNPNNPVHP